MIPRSVLTAAAPGKKSGEPSGAPAGRHLKLTRLLLLPTFLLFSVLVAACGSSSPSPSASANTQIEAGLKAESQGQTQQALNDFNAAVKADPTSTVAFYDLGVIYQEHLNNTAQAATEYQKALSTNSNYQPALYNLATIEASSNPESAINLYSQLIKLSPNQSSALFNLGLLQIASSNPTTRLAGHENLKKAIAIDPSLANRLPSGVTP